MNSIANSCGHCSIGTEPLCFGETGDFIMHLLKVGGWLELELG